MSEANKKGPPNGLDREGHPGATENSTHSPITWEYLISVDPRLRLLARVVAAERLPEDHPDFWRRWSLYTTRLRRYVGWEAERPELTSWRCYHVAYDHLLSIYEGGQFYGG